MEDTAQILRTELRQNDGDLYLCHLFVPTAHRFRMLALYTGYAEIARVVATAPFPTPFIAPIPKRIALSLFTLNL